jgi:hypothetical protein
MHVFADLQSYICTHEQCRDALKTFSTRKLWADHEFNEHFTVLRWRCFTCRAIISTPQSFTKHMIECHDIVLTAHRLAAAITEAQEAELTPEFKKHQCALCSQSGWQSRKAYATHVGKHLEEISLACLPRDEGGSSDDDLDTDTSSAETVVLGDHHKKSLSVSYQNLTAAAGEEVEETESLQALKNKSEVENPVGHIQPSGEYLEVQSVSAYDQQKRHQLSTTTMDVQSQLLAQSQLLDQLPNAIMHINHCGRPIEWDVNDLDVQQDGSRSLVTRHTLPGFDHIKNLNVLQHSSLPPINSIIAQSSLGLEQPSPFDPRLERPRNVYDAMPLFARQPSQQQGQHLEHHQQQISKPAPRTDTDREFLDQFRNIG